jgi:hypothetical protein
MATKNQKKNIGVKRPAAAVRTLKKNGAEIAVGEGDKPEAKKGNRSPNKSSATVETLPITLHSETAAPSPEATLMPAAKPSRLSRNHLLVGLVLAVAGALVLWEAATVFKTKNAQQRTLALQGNFGMRGGDLSNPATYSGPIQLRINPNDKLFLVDVNLNRILVYDAKEKKYLTTLDKVQAGQEGFRPIAVDGDAQDLIYVLDKNDQTIKVFSVAGKLLRIFPAANSDALCVEPQGSLLLSDKQTMQIVRMDAQGNVLKRIGRKGGGNGEFLNLLSIVTDPEGMIYTLDIEKAAVQIFNGQGKFIKQWGLKFKPSGLSSIFYREKKLYVADFNGTIYAYKPNGSLVWRIKASWPLSPVQDSAGLYYVPNENGIGYYELQ